MSLSFQINLSFEVGWEYVQGVAQKVEYFVFIIYTMYITSHQAVDGFFPASEMTYIVSSGALNSTHSLTDGF